ncbi:MAG: type VI secretion system membrane subunit TssM [Acetobacteraceae bacterium]|nr:type VI secretion system membrane subunit TssM [Acetobacteraceae bacterium]
MLNLLISFVGVALLAVLVWFLGPLVPWLDGVVVRGAICLVLLLVWAGYAVWTVVRWRKQGRELERGLVAAAAAEEVGAIQERFAAAIATLRQAGSLHSQPWYVIIGPPGAGKTTALLNAGLSFPFAGKAGGAHLAGVGGTRDCDWWFTDEAVLIDTAGRYTTQDSDGVADSAGWGAFLDLLRRTRPRQPLNGIIVAIPAVEIAGVPQALRSAHARAVRERVEELNGKLKTDLPVYLLFTKADLLAGFTEFFDDLDAERRGQVWGTTFPLSRRPLPVPDTGKALEALVARLDERVIDRLQAERSPERRRLIAGFPTQVASLVPLLSSFVEEAFGGHKLRQAPLLRGIYLTSGTQSGTPVDRLTAVLARSFALAPARLASLRPEKGRSYFLHRLMSDVLPGEAMLVSSRPEIVRRRRLLRGAGYAGTLLATAAACAAIWHVRAGNLQAQAAVAQALSAQAAEAARLPLDPVADTDALRLLPLLDQAQAMPLRTAVESQGNLLDQDATLGEISRTTYRLALQRDLLPRLLRRLEAQLAASSDRPEDAYNATRVYLMLGGAGPLDPALVRNWLQQDWNERWGGAAQQRQRDQLAQHLDALLAAPLPAVELDGALVDRARAVFNRVSPAARVYSRIRSSAAGQAVPPWRPRSAMGPLGSALFTVKSGRSLDDGVPGLFTPAGYYDAFLPAIAPTIRAVAAESWVTGNPVKADDDSARLAAIEQEVDGLYRADFIRTWDGFLDDLQFTPFRSVAQAAQDLYVLTSPQSPIRQILGSIALQVSLPPPQGVAAAPKLPGQPSRASGPAAAIAAHYRPLIDLVGQGPGAPLDQALRSLTDLQQWLAKLAAAAINVPAPSPGTTDPAAALSTEAQRWPEPLRRWFMTMADSAAALRPK